MLTVQGNEGILKRKRVSAKFCLWAMCKMNLVSTMGVNITLILDLSKLVYVEQR